MEPDDLVDALETIARTHWDDTKRPMLLSQLPHALSQHLPNRDYRSALSTKSLKDFIKDSQSRGKYRLVEHATQRAKLGIVPPSADYEFPVDEQVHNAGPISRQDVEGFTRVLRSLSPEELRRVSLPAALVVRLLDTQ